MGGGGGGAWAKSGAIANIVTAARTAGIILLIFDSSNPEDESAVRSVSQCEFLNIQLFSQWHACLRKVYPSLK
jgi:hypothetical protein